MRLVHLYVWWSKIPHADWPLDAQQTEHNPSGLGEFQFLVFQQFDVSVLGEILRDDLVWNSMRISLNTFASQNIAVTCEGMKWIGLAIKLIVRVKKINSRGFQVVPFWQLVCEHVAPLNYWLALIYNIFSPYVHVCDQQLCTRFLSHAENKSTGSLLRWDSNPEHLPF